MTDSGTIGRFSRPRGSIQDGARSARKRDKPVARVSLNTRLQRINGAIHSTFTPHPLLSGHDE